MSRKITFDDVELMERLFEQLSSEESNGSVYGGFKEWEILHELDRQAHRREYDKSPQRIEERHKLAEKRMRVRKYITEHPEVQKKMEAKIHGSTSKS